MFQVSNLVDLPPWRTPAPNQRAYIALYYDIENIYSMLDYMPVEFVPKTAIVDLQEANRLIWYCVVDGLYLKYFF